MQITPSNTATSDSSNTIDAVDEEKSSKPTINIPKVTRQDSFGGPQYQPVTEVLLKDIKAGPKALHSFRNN